MKHIVQFSGGAASSYAAWLVSQEFGKENTILLFQDTKVEHKDAYRFRSQVSEFIGIPITEYSDGRDLWQIIDDNNCLPSNFIPFCTKILKQVPGEKFLKLFSDEDYIIYNGFGIEEYRRVQKVQSRAELLNRVVKSPLFERRISEKEVRDTIINKWHICLPEPYLYLNHNNCIPCFKGGMSYWRKILKYYSEAYFKAEEYEEKIGHTVFQDYSLKELASRWNNGQLDMFSEQEAEMLPCLCAV